ncbi:MAG: hypothetical protein JWP81_534 [Ferruginibacter sp.]|nr:hypothetical protein [Ferruginibacter sp.]
MRKAVCLLLIVSLFFTCHAQEKVDINAINKIKKEGLIVAAFVYNTANRNEKLPRKELPKARPESRR